MSQTVTRSQVAARSKLCTLFVTLRAILQSPQPKSATTREEGLEYTKGVFKAIGAEADISGIHTDPTRIEIS